MSRTEQFANQSRALRLAAKSHENNGNDWLAKVMDFSSKYFAEQNKVVNRKLDAMLDEMDARREYRESCSRSDGYLYNINQSSFHNFREDWFDYNSQYGDYNTLY